MPVGATDRLFFDKVVSGKSCLTRTTGSGVRKHVRTSSASEFLCEPERAKDRY